MNRLLIGLTIGSLLTLLNFYHAHAKNSPSLELTEKRKHLAELIIDTAVNTDPAIHQLNYTQGWLLDHEVPQYYIASYLGLMPEHLSRLRKKV